jgi:acyl dehydratase
MSQAPVAPWRSYEDVQLDARFAGVGRTITEADIMIFTALTTGFHQPLHSNAEWVKANTKFKGVILPGPAILAYAIGLLSATQVYSTITVAFLGLDKVRAKGPVYAGDTINAVAGVASKRLASNPQNAIIDLAIEVAKQDGEVVMTFVYTLMVRAG